MAAALARTAAVREKLHAHHVEATADATNAEARANGVVTSVVAQETAADAMVPERSDAHCAMAKGKSEATREVTKNAPDAWGQAILPAKIAVLDCRLP